MYVYISLGMLSYTIFSLCVRKPTIWVYNQARHKPGCTVTEDGYRLEILDLERYRTIRVAKTQALISCTVTAQLICAFVFAYADCWFSHAQAHFPFNIDMKLNSL